MKYTASDLIHRHCPTLRKSSTHDKLSTLACNLLRSLIPISKRKDWSIQEKSEGGHWMAQEEGR